MALSALSTASLLVLQQLLIGIRVTRIVTLSSVLRINMLNSTYAQSFAFVRGNEVTKS